METRSVCGGWDANQGDSITRFENYANAFQVVDGGAGDDRIVAMQTGGRFIGDEGDDRFLLLDLDWLAARAAAENPSITLISGGPGVDRVMVSGDDLTDIWQEGAFTFLEFQGSVRGGGEVTQRVRLSGVEFVETADEVLRLFARDPNFFAPNQLTIEEDPWSTVKVFDDDGPSRLPDQDGTVIAISEAGEFTYQSGNSRVAVAVGMKLTADEIASLVFTPNQKFAVGTGGNTGDVIQNGAELLIRYPILDDNGVRVLDDDGVALTQERSIAVLPGDLDGVSLGMGMPFDLAANAISLDFGKPFTERGMPSDWVHLGTQTNTALREDVEQAEQAVSEAESDYKIAQRDYRTKQFNYERGQDLHASNVISDSQLAVLRQERDEAAEVVDEAEEALADANTALDAAQINARFESRTLLDSLPGTRLGDGQTYTVTEIPEGGQLWTTNITPEVGQDWINQQQVFVSDKLTRAQLEYVAFHRTDGVVNEDDFVTLIPDELLVADILIAPDKGVVFSSVSELDFTDPLFWRPEGYELQEDPEAGTLFWRDENQARITVSSGDWLNGRILEQLLFDADIDRRATFSDADELAEEIDALNRPTADNDGEDGVGASAVPPDPTALALRLKALAPEIEIDGAVIDLGAVSVSEALPFTTNPGTYRYPGAGFNLFPVRLVEDVEWTQWRTEDGGNGHFYALAELTGDLNGSNRTFYIDNYLDNWNDLEGAGNTDLGARPIQMASVGSAAENDFLWSLFADDPGQFLQPAGAADWRHLRHIK